MACLCSFSWSDRVAAEPSGRRVHVVGAGPVGLFLTALLQSIDGQTVRLYERRGEYTRTRMVSLAEYLVADSIESYKADPIDGQDVEAIFEPAELETGLAYRRSIAPDLRALLDEWTRGFVPLNTIERALSDAHRRPRRPGRSSASPGDVTADAGAGDARARRHPRRLHRRAVAACATSSLPGDDGATRGRNTKRFRLEYALVVTFLYGQHYACNEFCKYYKNLENVGYKFIPAVHRTFYDGVRQPRDRHHQHQPGRVRGDATGLRRRLAARAVPGASPQSMDRFIDKVKAETHGELVGDLEITADPAGRLPGAERHEPALATSRALDHPLAERAGLPARGRGDRLAVLPVDLPGPGVRVLPRRPPRRPDPVGREMFDRYEAFMYQQWLRVYMRTQMIKHNKDLLESVDDTFGAAGEAARLLGGSTAGSSSRRRAARPREIQLRHRALRARPA